MDMLAVDPDFRQKIVHYAVAQGGVLYNPILHPGLSDLPYLHGPERFKVVRAHIPASAKTALDIGAHWGYWSHLLEDLGLEVIAVENSAEAVEFLTEIRRISDKKFAIAAQDVLELPLPHVDIVLALNVFHLFLRRKPVFERFQGFLRRLDCGVMIYQAHDLADANMRDAYKRLDSVQMCKFIIANTSLSNYEEIGGEPKRKMYRIWK